MAKGFSSLSCHSCNSSGSCSWEHPSLSLPTPSDDCSDLLICSLWSTGAYSILDDYIMNMDAEFYYPMILWKYWPSMQQNKKKKGVALCLALHCHFTPFIVSADGIILCHEANTVACPWALTYGSKTEKFYSVGWALYAITLAMPFFVPLAAVFKVPQGTDDSMFYE